LSFEKAMTRILNEAANESRCPKCHNGRMKSWQELDSEERMVAERLPLSAEISLTKRKKHRFCTRCWFEFAGDGEMRA
jgi:hypothetical protein